MSAFHFINDIEFDGKPCTVEGIYFIIEKGDRMSPTPHYRVLNVAFQLHGINLKHEILADRFFVQVFIDGNSSIIGHPLNQRPESYPHPFYQRLKEIVMDTFEDNVAKKIHP